MSQVPPGPLLGKQNWYKLKRFINPRVLKITVTNAVCTWRCWTLPLWRFERAWHLLWSQQLRAKILSNSRQQAKPVNSNYFRKIFWKIARLLGKIKNTVSLRFRSLTFPSKKSSSERTCPYWQWIVCTEKGQWPAPMVHQRKHIHSVCCEDNYFPKGKFKFFNSLFLSVYLVFLNTFDFYCRRHSSQVAWLVYSACLHSHVLRTCCNFESKQAISITLFGRRTNNKERNLTSHGISNIQELLMLRCLHFPLTLFADRIESVK